MTDHLRDRIAAALYERERPSRDPHWPDAYAMDREVFEAMADAVHTAVQPELDRLARAEEEASRWAEAESADAAAGSYAGRAERAETELDRLRALVRDILGQFHGMRAADDPTGEITEYRCRVLPYEYERWREQAAGAATQATDGPACTCGGRFPIHHIHADQHQPKGI